MKKISILLLVVMSLIVSGCDQLLTDPIASFTYQVKQPYSVVITDNSVASRIEYDFGDDSEIITITPSEQITHKYSTSGSYIIKAVAYNSKGTKNELHKDVKISDPKVYVTGMEFVRIIDEDEYFRFSLKDDGPIIIKEWVSSGWSSNILYSAILPKKILLNGPILLENIQKHTYYTLYVYHTKDQSNKEGVPRLAQKIHIGEILSGTGYVERHNDKDDTVVRLLLTYK